MRFADQPESTPNGRTVALPIHPLVTLECWASALQIEIADGQLSRSDTARLLEQVERDPDARRYYHRAVQDDVLLLRLFGVPQGREVA